MVRPKDLKSPFTHNEPSVLIEDRVWYVPCCIPFDFPFPGWESSQLFGKRQPIFVEYCSGNGAWITAKAAENPGVNWVAVERKFDRVRKIWSKMKNGHLHNLVIICGEALAVTRHYFPDSSVAKVFINFPDPWPKKRHAKHRLIRPPFVEELYRILQVGGKTTLVTDDEPFSEEAIRIFSAHPGFSSLFSAPFFVTESLGYGTSYFETLWRDKGKTIRYHQFKTFAISEDYREKQSPIILHSP